MEVTRESIQPVIEALETAWNRGDGEAFAALCTPDVDFINLLGMYVKGRAPVAGLHEKILNGPYAGSTLAFSIEHVRPLSSDAALAVVSGELQVPSGPVQGLIKTVATVLFVRQDSEWRVASFQNTKREAGQANFSAIMLETLAKKT